MKVFDINMARQGAAVCTRNGNKARIICFDRKHSNRSPIIALVEIEGEEYVKAYTEDGAYTGMEDFIYDLMMAPVRKKVWANFYKTAACNIVSDQLTWDSKDDAVKNSMEHPEWIGAYEVEVEI